MRTLNKQFTNRMPNLSDRVEAIPQSPIRKLAPYAQEAYALGRKVYSLNIGQPDLPTPPEAFEALRNIDRKVLEYSPSDGFASLRSKLSEYYSRFNIEVTPQQIIITCGGSEALLFAFMATLNPGDELILPEPAYANYGSMSILVGAKTVGIPANIENGFNLPPIEEFEKAITPRTKGILICNPNNPTGYVYSRKELEQLADIVKRHNLFLFADEVYREFCYSDRHVTSALQLEGIEDNVILVDSVSKRYSECGIRIGAIVTKNRHLRDCVMKLAQARLSPPLIGQLVAQASIDVPQRFIREEIAEYRRRRDFLINGLNEIPGVVSPLPEGAFYTVAQLPVDNAEKFCKWCLKEFEYNGGTVFMAPAAGFYSTPGRGEREVRIAYVIKEEDLAAALVCLRKALEEYPGRVKE